MTTGILHSWENITVKRLAALFHPVYRLLEKRTTPRFYNRAAEYGVNGMLRTRLS